MPFSFSVSKNRVKEICCFTCSYYGLHSVDLRWCSCSCSAEENTNPWGSWLKWKIDAPLWMVIWINFLFNDLYRKPKFSRLQKSSLDKMLYLKCKLFFAVLVTWECLSHQSRSVVICNLADNVTILPGKKWRTWKRRRKKGTKTEMKIIDF